MTTAIEIALIDDEPAVLDSTRMLLQQEGFRVRSFDSADAFLEALDASYEVDCVVTDVRMPGKSGLDLQSALATHNARLPVILLTGHGDIAMAVAALKAGASDFIEKPFAIDHLVSSVRTAVERARASQVTEQSRAEIMERAAQLTQRQREVMDLVVEGYSSKQIASRLGISVRTVETYRIWVMEKMGAGSIAALVRMAIQLPPSEKKEE